MYAGCFYLDLRVLWRPFFTPFGYFFQLSFDIYIFSQKIYLHRFAHFKRGFPHSGSESESESEHGFVFFEQQGFIDVEKLRAGLHPFGFVCLTQQGRIPT